MKSLLAKFARRKAIGLYVGEADIAISCVAATVLGPVEVSRHCESFTPDQFSSVLHKFLAPHTARKRSGRQQVAFGLPALRIFFSTRPMKAANVDASPQVLLHEVLRSPTVCVDDVVVDLIQSKPGKRSVASLAACRKKYLAPLMAAVQECGVRPYRVEPAPCALLRVAAKQHRAPRRAKTVLRMFLGEKDGLAVLATATLPLVWRSFLVPTADDSSVLLSVMRTLRTLAKYCGTEAAADVVMIHGRPDLREAVDLPALAQQVDTKIIWHDGPGLDHAAIAFGVAQGCLVPNPEAFDLARSLKPRASLWELFPWGEVALQLALLVCVGLFLANHSQEVSEKYGSVRAETTRRAWLGTLQEQQLAKEKKNLEQRVDAIRVFLATRILWSDYARDIPSRLPEGATLNNFQGVCDMEQIGRKTEAAIKPKKSFLLRVAAPIPQTGAAPHEIDGFLDSLRGYDLLKRDFPLVELADIKWYQPFMGAKPIAYFTVVCMPKAIVPGAPSGDGGGKKAEH